MRENAEYCTGQDFQLVFTAYPPTIYDGGFQLWQCKKCAYEFPRHPISDEPTTVPLYHPKPIPMRFTMSDEQKARLRAMLESEQL